MRIVTILACLTLLIAPLAVQAGEKSKAQSQLEAARAAVEAFSKKSDQNKLVAADLESARAFLKKGEEAFAAGRTMFGLGDVNPEAAQDVKLDTDMVELHLALGQSRMDSAKAEEELAVMRAQVSKMKGKVKVFDDRKAELESLRASLVKFEATVRELGDAKAENVRLAEKAGKLEQAAKGTEAELARLKTELAKRDLAPPDPATPPAPEEVRKP